MRQRHHHNGDHHHDHDHSHDHSHDHTDHHTHGGPGHNQSPIHKSATQWQTPHQLDSAVNAKAAEPDLDQVETAFVNGFLTAPDPTSFLRLARIPFEFRATDGANMQLLRVEIDALTDVGSLTPHLGGESFRYDPLPVKFVSHRRRLRFVYFDGSTLRPLTFPDLRVSGKV